MLCFGYFDLFSKTNENLYDEQWELAHHYPFVPKDAQKRTCAKALVMTHAYSNAVIDKIEEAVKRGYMTDEERKAETEKKLQELTGKMREASKDATDDEIKKAIDTIVKHFTENM